MNIDLEVILLITMILLCVLITLMVSNRINDILMNVKKQKDIPTPVIHNDPNGMIVKIETSSKQLQFIDFTVLHLLQIRASNSLLLNQPIKTKDIDLEVKELSLKVKEALRPEFFRNPNSLYDEAFLMRYMIEKCKVSLIDLIRQTKGSHSE